MGKDSHFTGQPVYSQVLRLLDKERILQISRATKGSEAYVKRFDGYQHLVVMLFGVLKHFDSLRELEIGMKAEARKLGHLGLDYLARRSALAEANIRRPQAFFADVYAHLLKKYPKFLADSRPPKRYRGQTREPKDWEKLLYMMDSTTITLFDNILKGVARHPKSGRKKGGMKVHTVMKYQVGVPMVVQLTSAAKHDHYLLKEVHLPKDSTLAMDRAYIDIAQFQRLTEEGVCYVTKMKRNLTYGGARLGDLRQPGGPGHACGPARAVHPGQAGPRGPPGGDLRWGQTPGRAADQQLRFLGGGYRRDIPPPVGHRVALQAAQAEFPAPFLLRGQRQRHPDTDLGGADRQPAHHRALQAHQAALRLLAGGDHGAPYADGVHRFHRVHGEPGQNVG
jgi:transposase DDE domain